MALECDFEQFENLVVMRLTGTPTADELGAGYAKIFERRTFCRGHALYLGLQRNRLEAYTYQRSASTPAVLRQFMVRRGSDYKAAIVTSRGSISVVAYIPDYSETDW